MKTLDLVLKAKWYNMIESGVKTEEYREVKAYWIKRLTKQLKSLSCDTNLSVRESKKFDAVKFHYGYTSKTMTFECLSISIDKGNPKWGAPENDYVFIIKLGKRIS